MHHSIVNQVVNAIVRSSVYHAVGSIFKGHGVVVSIVIAVVLIGGVVAFRRFAPRLAS